MQRGLSISDQRDLVVHKVDGAPVGSVPYALQNLAEAAQLAEFVDHFDQNSRATALLPHDGLELLAWGLDDLVVRIVYSRLGVLGARLTLELLGDPVAPIKSF